ncbi:MAG: TlyA family rRNA (cytidine-2'-O)-methyltransferase [Rhizobiales bacterium 65-9]|nr:TlyA family RNA methyltransferase [Hyphomicrobiales bacterium]OJY37319.1 MAG: TlyA family rRNA (cytidine-2'-O)-methyltransferase [Rhizobiales bacterium 65-9]
MAERRRIDQLLVARGFFESRARAQAAIAAGLVRVNGAVARKPSDSFGDDARVEAEQPFPWVSRGGVKLSHALDAFHVEAAGRLCLDVGSSTGGFTDVLLARHAARVIAVDVGRDQMHAKLRGDPRLSLHEQTDIRDLALASKDRASLAVVDASFISLTLIIPALASLTASKAELVALIKPQFEAGRGLAGKRGVVDDDAVRARAVDNVKAFADKAGWRVTGVIDSPIEGGDGNREYLMHARKDVGSDSARKEPS